MDKVEVRNWRAVRDAAHRAGLTDPERVGEHERDMLSEVRAQRLVDLRRARSMTQTDVADAMKVAQPRVSQIERGDLAHSELGTLRGYVEALGGHLRVVADFGDQTVTVE